MTCRTLLVWSLFVCAPAAAADWPQWRGPDRNDVSKETGLLKDWPANGPPLLWTFDHAGLGYSGPAVVGDRLYTLGARDGNEYVLALDVRTGKEVWATRFAAEFQNGWGDGPRGTPAVDGELLYAIGGQGELVCCETATGKVRWSIGLRKDLGGQLMSGWGYSESPLVDGAHVICCPGGDRGTMAALDKHSGKVAWRSTDLTDKATYSSVVVATVGGVRQYVQTTYAGGQDGAVVGVRASDGKLLWRYERDGYRTAVIPTPIVKGDLVYVTVGYGAGCDLLRLVPDGEGTKVEKIFSDRTMDNKHGGAVWVEDHVYGWTDQERGRWICQAIPSGKVVWESKKLGRGSITYADGRLYCYSENNGTCVLIEASPEGWKEHGRFTIPKESGVRSPSGGVWTHPVVANGRLYLRDQDLLYCFDVKN